MLTRMLPLVVTAAMLFGSAARAQDANLSVAVFPVQLAGLPPDVGDRLVAKLVDRLRARSQFGRVLLPGDINAVLPAEQQKQLLACLEDKCAVVDETMVAQLGVTHLLHGRVKALGARAVISFQLLNLKTAILVATVSESVSELSEPAILSVIDPLVDRMLERASLLRPLPPPGAAPPAPPPQNTVTTTETAPPPTEEPGIPRAVLLLGGGSALALVGGVVGLLGGAFLVGGIATVVLAVQAIGPPSTLYGVGAVCFVVGAVFGVIALALMGGGVALAIMGQRGNE